MCHYENNKWTNSRGFPSSGVAPELSKEATKRLKWFDCYRAHGHNARLTCRHFDISPQTFYRWERRYNARPIESLESRSHRPKRLRQPSYTTELVEAVLRIREDNPCWGKYKLVSLLGEDGYEVSASISRQDITPAQGARYLNRPAQELALILG